jgi:galactokinase
MDLSVLRGKFKELFKTDEAQLFFAPGRANLIGEHIDYNGGHVFPCALTFGTYLMARKRGDDNINFYSLNFEGDGLISTTLSELKRTDNWTNYPRGVVNIMMKEGYKIDSGFDAVYYGDIPNGAGLSSSASIEVLTGVMLQKFFKLELSKEQNALIGQRVENEFIGLNSGIMDQFIIAVGKKDNAVLLNTETLKYKYVPVKLEGVSILLANTNVRRDLIDSKYNERRAQCEAALEILQKTFDVKNLCGIREKDLPKAEELLKDEPVLLKRARHAITEEERATKAVALLEKGDIEAFAKLMDGSHESLRCDYEVTGKELDAMVEALQAQRGVLGARMMGGGFAGCAVALVWDDFIDQVRQKTGEEYFNKIGLRADFYVAGIGDGAMEIKD